MTLIEAAASLGCSPDNLRAAIKRGSLTATKVKGAWQVTPEAVEVYRTVSLGKHGRKP